MKLSFTHFVCKVCLTDVLNCYIDGKFLIHGHGYRVLVLWSVIIQDFRLCAVLSALFLLLVVVKPVQVQLERNQIALLARVLALLVTVERKSHLERAKFVRSSVGASSAAP